MYNLKSTRTLRFINDKGQNRKSIVPVIVPFESRHTMGLFNRRCFYDFIGYRKPLRGEYYLSGAVVEAYCAPNDLPTPYLVVKPTYAAKQETIWVKGESIN